MQANQQNYIFSDSLDRIREILDSSDNDYADSKSIPARTSLTYANGYYVDVTALFIDLRGSKELATKHTKPVLAKIYRAFISEMTAAMRNHAKVSEIYIEGDCVWAIYDTPYKSDIDAVFDISAILNALVLALNVKLKKKNYSELTAGIGMAYGESLYVKAGHKGSGVNEVVWLGKVVGEAAKLCGNASKGLFAEAIMVSTTAYSNLNDENKKFLKFDVTLDCYSGSPVNSQIYEWVKQNA